MDYVVTIHNNGAIVDVFTMTTTRQRAETEAIKHATTLRAQNYSVATVKEFFAARLCKPETIKKPVNKSLDRDIERHQRN